MRVSGRPLFVAMLAALVLIPAVGKAAPEDAALDRMIDRELHAGGPFFTAPERALVERKCGYAPGSWSGFNVNITNNVLVCSNGRRIDDAEMRAVLRVAEPRISRRVEAVMRNPEITAAIDRVADAATAQALRELRANRDD